MPIAAVAVAIGSLAMGGAAAIGTVAGAIATGATIGIGDALAAVASIGAVTSAVGAVTGNKALTDAGIAMGAVGGIGALAANAGLLGSDAATTSSFFGTGGSAAANAADGMAEDLNLATTTGGASASGGGDIIDSINGTAPSPASAEMAVTKATAAPPVASIPPGSADTAAAATPTSGLVNSSIPNPSSDGMTEDLNLATGSENAMPPNQVQVASGATQAGATTPPPPGAPVTNAPVSKGSAAPNNPSVGGSGMSETMQLAQLINGGNMKTALVSGGISAAGSLLSGLTSPVTPAQVQQLQSQAAANNAAAAQAKTQETNMTQPLPTVTNGGNTMTKPGGLINTPVNANVTGVVA